MKRFSIFSFLRQFAYFRNNLKKLLTAYPFHSSSQFIGIHSYLQYILYQVFAVNPPRPLYERGSRSKVIRFLYDAFKIDLTERDKQLNNISTYFYFISVYFR